MGLFSRNKNNKSKDVEERDINLSDALLFNGVNTYREVKAMNLSSVNACVETISDAISSLPISIYRVDSCGHKMRFTQHPTFHILNREPNGKMTRYTFMKLMVQSMLLRGNAYAYIERDRNGNCIGLHYIPTEYVTIHYPIAFNDSVTYSVVGFNTIIEGCNMLHILNYTNDGISGISTLAHAKQTLEMATDEFNTAQGFYRGGANLNGILKVNSNLTTKQKETLKASWQRAYSTLGQNGGIAILEGGMEYSPTQVNPSDAELLESRKFSTEEICRFFRVSPQKVFDQSHTSYSTLEATQLAFLTDTLMPLLVKFESEFERKLFKPSEKEDLQVRFDTTQLLRGDKQTLASYYNTLFQLGVLSPNEIRKELDLSHIENGDEHYIQVNLMTLENASKNVPNDKRINNDNKNNDSKVNDNILDERN